MKSHVDHIELDYLIALRRDMHRHPELLYDLPRTSALVAEELRRAGCDHVVTGVGRSGVVGVIKGQLGEGRCIGLRADMDALPIVEQTGLEYGSTVPGLMHACGHDGHSAGLIGGVRQLARHRHFKGTAVCIFQPAEEGGAGAKAMLNDDLVGRFGIDEFYALHNFPGLPVGTFAVRAGPVMAAGCRFDIEIDGRGGHAARPQEAADPVAAATHIAVALQTIVSRNIDPLDSVVLSVTSVSGGTAYNVIPGSARLRGTIRFLQVRSGELCIERLKSLVESIATGFNCLSRIALEPGYPVTENHADQTEVVRDTVKHLWGNGSIQDAPVQMASEDFSYMLQARPGAYILFGNGEGPACHHPGFDFADAALPHVVAFWDGLMQQRG